MIGATGSTLTAQRYKNTQKTSNKCKTPPPTHCHARTRKTRSNGVLTRRFLSPGHFASLSTVCVSFVVGCGHRSPCSHVQQTDRQTLWRPRCPLNSLKTCGGFCDPMPVEDRTDSALPSLRQKKKTEHTKASSRTHVEQPSHQTDEAERHRSWWVVFVQSGVCRRWKTQKKTHG